MPFTVVTDCPTGNTAWSNLFDTERTITMSITRFFAVADKKKKLAAYFNEASGNTITLKTTGRCGLEALVWCYRTMVDFEGYLADFSIPSKVAVIGEDQRRFRAYEKALSKKGYQKVFLDGQWTMIKTIVA